MRGLGFNGDSRPVGGALPPVVQNQRQQNPCEFRGKLIVVNLVRLPEINNNRAGWTEMTVRYSQACVFSGCSSWLGGGDKTSGPVRFAEPLLALPLLPLPTGDRSTSPGTPDRSRWRGVRVVLTRFLTRFS
eukprot:COSAG02_NODE_10809_length_1854_cov_1.212536_3_plen_130_part_01